MLSMASELYVVNIEKLKRVKFYKNFKALVQDMGWRYYSTKSTSSKAQMKALSAACRWSFDVDESGKKLSNRVLIHEVYERKKLIVDKRKSGDRALLGRLISRSILEVLADYNREHPIANESMDNVQKMYITYGGLYTKIGMVNENYLKGKHSQHEVSSQLQLPLQHVNDFYSCTQDNMKQTLQRSLNELYKQRLVRHRQTKRLVFKSIVLSDTNLKGLSEQHTLRAEIVTSSAYATEDQDAYIFYAERQVLIQYGFRNISEVYHLRKEDRQQFFADVMDYIHHHCVFSKSKSVQSLVELDYYYSALELSYYSPFIDQAVQMEKKMSREDRQEVLDHVSHELIEGFLSTGGDDYVLAINQEQMRRTHQNALNRHNKAKRDPSVKDLRLQRADSTYVDSMDKLTGAMLNQHSSFELTHTPNRKQVAIKTK